MKTRKIGTIAAAFGLVYLGIWMIFRSMNPVVASTMFKFWPVMFLILGLEILLSAKNEVKKLNPFIIAVVIVFLVLNISFYIRSKIPANVMSKFGINFMDKTLDSSLGNLVDKVELDNNSKSIETQKALESFGSDFKISCDNAKFRFHTATDNKIKLTGKIYVKDSSNIKSYDIKANKSNTGYDIAINEDYVKKVELDVYIPNGLKVNVQGDNFYIVKDEAINSTEFKVEADNVSLNLENLDKLEVKCDNAKISAKDAKTVIVNTDKGSVDLTGKSDIVNVKGDNLKISVTNLLCKDVKLSSGNGVVTVDTKDKNVDVNIQVNAGVCTLNSERKINGSISKKMGTGEDKVDIKVGNGAVKFSSQE